MTSNLCNQNGLPTTLNLFEEFSFEVKECVITNLNHLLTLLLLLYGLENAIVLVSNQQSGFK